MKAISNGQESRKLRAQRLVQWRCFVGCIVGLAVVTGVGLIRTHAQESFPLPAINPPGTKASAPASGSAPSPAAQSAPQQAGTTASGTSTPEVAEQCAELLKLATDLKTAVDKSSSGTLSVTVVRTAGEIEQLAHKVRLTNGKN
jgi:hypothetical protein